MSKLVIGFFSLFVIIFNLSVAQAQDTVKIGVVLALSGPFADPNIQLDNGIKLYLKEHGNMVAGKKIVIIRKDVGGIAPDVAKRLAQELVVRDKVDILAGLLLTPNAMAVGDVSKAAKKFTVIMNAATAVITLKSPYMARVSLTVPQLNVPFGKWAAKQGIKTVYTIVSDYGPGRDGETAFHQGFKAGGGKVVGSVRIPLRNPDFSAYVQRAKDSKAEAIFAWIPGGAQPAAFGKALAARGLNTKNTKILGQGEVASEKALEALGDAGLGIVTSLHYDYNHKSAMNTKFVAAYNKEFKRNPDIYSVGGYDGMHLIFEALKKTKGKTGGQALIDAAKGMAWESPRGPISIDPETRDVIQTVYIRRVEKVNGKLVNIEFDKIENVKDPVKAAMMKKKK